MGFTAFGFNVGPYFKDYQTAYSFGKLAVTLSDLQYVLYLFFFSSLSLLHLTTLIIS